MQADDRQSALALKSGGRRRRSATICALPLIHNLWFWARHAQPLKSARPVTTPEIPPVVGPFDRLGVLALVWAGGFMLVAGILAVVLG